MASLITLLGFCSLIGGIYYGLSATFFDRGPRLRIYLVYFVFLVLLPYTILLLLSHPFPVLDEPLHTPLLIGSIVTSLFVYVRYHVLAHYVER